MKNEIDLIQLARQVTILRHWLDVQQEADQSSRETSTDKNLEVWRDALEELSVCQEALRHQHDQLTIALQAAEKERQRYQDLFDFAPDGYVVTDTAGAVRKANEAAGILLGQPKEWLIGRPLTLFVEQEERRRFRIRLNRSLTEPRRHEWDVQLKPYNRPSFFASIIVAPFFDAAGGGRQLLWLIRDVSAQKWMEEELRKTSHELAQRVTERTAQLIATNETLRAEIITRQQIQSQLIENERLAVLGVTAEKVSHEIGNTLNNLSTTMQLQRAHINSQPSLRDATLAAMVQDSQQQLQRLNETVHGWRSLAQQSRLHFESVDCSALISNALESYASRAADQEVRVEQSLPEDLPHLRVDREKMQRALSNLYANALSAMPTGGTLTVRASQAEECVIVEVGDTGPSLPRGINLFDLFTTTLPPGIGLGLAIAEQIVGAHGGKMTYESDPDIGTILRVALPVAR